MFRDSVIGKGVPRVDAREKVTGAAAYLDDISLPRMVHAKILRSPYPHAKILNIDVSRARALPGVKDVITAVDTPRIKIGFGKDNLPLKTDKVRCVGDEVAAVAAVDEDTAEEALELIRVDYEPLPAVFDPELAMKPGSPLIHEGTENNISLHYHFEVGDPEKALAECYRMVSERYVLPFVTPCCMETHGCIASYDPAGNLTIWSTTQVPFLYQKELADALGIQGSRVRVIKPVLGGGFGSRLEMYPFEVVVAVLAQRTGRPVKMVYTREEEFIASRPRQPIIIDLTTGADRGGRLVARVARCILDNGAYNSWGSTSPLVGMQTVTSLYRVPNSRYDAYVVYTNNPYAGAMRGYGNPQATFAVESQMDGLAHELGMDPLEFRLLNANEPGEVTPQKMVITSCAFKESLQAAAEAVGWKAPRRPGHGVGVAGYLHVAGGARVYRSDGCGALIKIDDMGKITLVTGATEMGQGSDTVQAQIAAEELGVTVEDIKVINTDTDLTPWDVGAHASRTTFIAGNAVRLAARDARRQLMEAASLALGVPPEELELAGKMVYPRGRPEKGVPFDKLVRSAHFRPEGRVIIGWGFYDPPNEMQDKGYRGNISAAYGFGAQAVEVEVDEETGRVEVLRIASAHDVGRVINPMGLEGQVEGGCAMGLGYALSEKLAVEEGRVLNPSFLDYRILTAKDMPEVKVIPIESDDSRGPFGAKGVGETPAIPTAAAVANAVYNAVGVRIRELPITPDKVLNALREKRERQAGDTSKSGGRSTWILF